MIRQHVLLRPFSGGGLELGRVVLDELWVNVRQDGGGAIPQEFM
jgi:hypothetical protein